MAVSSKIGANFRGDFADALVSFWPCDESCRRFERCEVSIGSGLNLICGAFACDVSSDLSLLLLCNVSMGSTANLRGFGAAASELFEVVSLVLARLRVEEVDVSTGSTANLRGLGLSLAPGGLASLLFLSLDDVDVFSAGSTAQRLDLGTDLG